MDDNLIKKEKAEIRRDDVGGLSGLLKNSNIPRWYWVPLLFFFTLIYASHIYGDILITARQGMDFWTVLFQGHPLDFYSYNISTTTGNMFYPNTYNAVYDFTIYLIFAVANFPLWILEHFAHIDVMNNYVCLLWIKLPLLIAILISTKFICKIYRLFNDNNAAVYWLAFFYLSSTLLFSSVLIMSQYDIFAVCFMLIGYYYYLKNDRLRFFIFFAVAISCKYFAFFIFVPLILLREKRIWYIVRDILFGLPLTLFWKLLFIVSGNGLSGTSGTGGYKMINKLYANTIPGGDFPVSTFLVAYLIIIVYSYIKKPQDNFSSQYNISLFSCVAVWAALFTLTGCHPYWVIMLVPFMVLMIFSNQNHLKTSIYLEIVYSGALFLSQSIRYYWCFSSTTMNSMLWGVITKSVSDSSFGHYLGQVSSIIGITLSSVTIAAMICLLYINYPRSNKLNPANQNIIFEIDKSRVLTRMVITISLSMLPTLFYLLQVLGYVG